jgi:general stress protein 26
MSQKSPDKSYGKQALSAERAHVHEMLSDFRTVILTTFDTRALVPELRSRPMAVAKLDEDCTLWFVTDLASSKVGEAMSAHVGNVIAQSTTTQLSMSGSFRIVRDVERIRAVWSKMYDVYFPTGPTDPEVCLLGFQPLIVEYWDVSGTKSLRYLADVTRALLTHEPPPRRKDEHATVDMRR